MILVFPYPMAVADSDYAAADAVVAAAVAIAADASETAVGPNCDAVAFARAYATIGTYCTKAKSSCCRWW